MSFHNANSRGVSFPKLQFVTCGRATCQYMIYGASLTLSTCALFYNTYDNKTVVILYSAFSALLSFFMSHLSLDKSTFHFNKKKVHHHYIFTVPSRTIKRHGYCSLFTTFLCGFISCKWTAFIILLWYLHLYVKMLL